MRKLKKGGLEWFGHTERMGDERLTGDTTVRSGVDTEKGEEHTENRISEKDFVYGA